MAERTYPGVYVEERRSGLAPIQGVSTSNFGIVGFTTQGPTNTATLVTSFPAFERTFGTFTSDSQVPVHVFAFFANSGRRAYVVRTVGSGAVTASGTIKNDTCETIGTGDGSTLIFGGTLTNIPLTSNAAGGNFSFTYVVDGTPVASEASNLDPTPDGAEVDFAGQLASAPVAGTVVLTDSGNTISYYDHDDDGILYDDPTAGVARGFIDYQTGHFTLSVGTGNEPALPGNVTYAYTPLSSTLTVADDGAGNMTGTDVASGTIDYTTGVWATTFSTNAPSNLRPLEGCYTQEVWDVSASSAGVWGNDIQVDVRGDDDFFTEATGTFTRYDVLVYQEDSDGNLDLLELFEDLSFTDATDNRYVATIVNNETIGSDYIALTEPSNEDVGPRSLSGYQVVRGGGSGNGVQTEFGTTDGTGGTPTIPAVYRTAVLAGPVQEGSVSITFDNAAGEVQTITDDGFGNLIGDVDPASAANFNTIDYTTGAFTFKANAAPSTYVLVGDDSIVTVTYYKAPTDTTESDSLASGTDGAALTRSELTDPTLKTAREGVYALLSTNELMNVAIPDAAGDVTMSTDLVTEAETNEKWFCILATGPGLTPQQARSYRINTLGLNSSYAALYYPYITVSDPVTDLPTNIPPAGHVAGAYARTDNAKNVGKAPAGTEDGKLLFSIGLERALDFEEVGILHPKQVNSLIDTDATGRAIWGARTLENPPSDFRYIGTRRLFNFLKLSIFNSSFGFVFEDVGPQLWSKIRLSVESFLLTLYSQGYFKGATPAEAYKVIVDESNNPVSVQDSGTVITDIYVATNVPGEFIVFRIQKKLAEATA
jgi:phage tail sheath protein FI